MARKDRRLRRELAPDVDIVFERSSSHPVEYALILRAWRDDEWHAVHVFDNAHASEEHHEHRFIGEDKQQAAVSHGRWEDAVAAAFRKLKAEYADIVNEWDQTR